MASWLDRLTRVLSQYSARDKSLRTLHSILILFANHLKDRVTFKQFTSSMFIFIFLSVI